MYADLHCHTTASDGLLTPTGVVERAHERGVGVLAITDHDTLDGLAEAQVAAARVGIELITGVELSCTWAGATIHVLGYAFAPEAPALVQAVDSLHQGRWARAEEIGRRLAAKGMPDCFAGAREVQQERGESGNAPSRPHFAEFMTRAGYVKDHSQAFQRWLGAGKLGDVKQHWPELGSTLDTLREAGAWISLAHPCHYDFTRTKRRKLVMAFVEGGGHALEVSNGAQADSQVGMLANTVREFGLLASAGSDFHGPRQWSELGSYRAPPEDLPVLWRRLTKMEHPRA
ncbi:PHP domain-containing protein [Pseudomonas sp. GCM10022188]|uniref:PHP domain-containing protein n=1 Tax=Pseudomonas TaxID=286 RepID=UPI001E429267|nr:PHP domain-containing protein [Pseudomonas oryzagri]MCC6076951.1 PHP domain-containing protein [Pseudomonas oryzagri]